jgi:hemolysin activation/secretion protein
LSGVDPTSIVQPTQPAQPSAPIEAPKAAPRRAEDATPRFVLVEAIFEGARAVSPRALAASWAGLKGKQVSIADLTGIALRAEAIYADHGYPFVAVVVTPQQVSGGRVHFRVVEGRISDLKTLGPDKVARRQATAAFAPLVDRQPLSSAMLEEAYRRAQHVPGLAIAGSLSRGATTGGMDLVLQARRRAWTTYVNVNNYYPDTVGPWGVLFGVSHAGASKYGDETSAQVYTSVAGGSQVVVRASHSQTLDTAGDTLAIMGLGGWAHPSGAVEQLSLATKVYAGRISLSRPLIDRLGETVDATGALEINDQTTKIFRTVGLTDDRLRIVSVSLAGELRGAGDARIAVQIEGRKGLDVLGASQPQSDFSSRLGANPQALVGKVSAEGEAPLFGRLRVAARFAGQISDSPLTSPEQYQIGNLSLGRGYQPGAALGDKVIGGSVELRAGPFHGPRKLTFQPYVFCDAVKLWTLTPGAEGSRALWSYGGGVRIEAPGRMNLDLLYAKPRAPPLGLGEPTPPARWLLNVTFGLNDVFSAIHRRLSHGGPT